MAAYHLAQLNIGRARDTTDSAVMAEFMAALDPINALAEQAPGFVWRFQTDEGNATALRPFPDDERMMVNFSVWENPEALRDFVYRTAHAKVMARRREWFEKMEIYQVLWWVPAGHRPSIGEAIERLEKLRTLGETAEAFTFKKIFAAPDTTTATADGFWADGCTAT